MRQENQEEMVTPPRKTSLKMGFLSSCTPIFLSSTALSCDCFPPTGSPPLVTEKMDSGFSHSNASFSSSSLREKCGETCNFSTDDEFKCLKRESFSLSGSCHHGSSCNTSQAACSSRNGGYPLESSLSLEELDALEAELELIHDVLTEDAVLDSTGLCGIGFGQDTTNGKPPEDEENKLAYENSAENKGTQIVTVPIDLIQNKRPFKCTHPGCEKTFRNPQTLRMHYKTHCSDEIPAKEVVIPACKAGQNKKIPCRCPVCGGTFVGLYELRRHFGRKHSEGEKTHRCRKCGKKFYVEVDLRDHLKLFGDPVGCKCGMKFAFKCNLLAHKKTHPECLDPPPIPEPVFLVQRDLPNTSWNKHAY